MVLMLQIGNDWMTAKMCIPAPIPHMQHSLAYASNIITNDVNPWCRDLGTDIEAKPTF